MKIAGWKYYNHAMMPTTIPKEMPDLNPLESGEIWKAGGVLLYWRDGQLTGIADVKRTGGM